MDDRLWMLFVDSLKALAAPSAVQLARFPKFVATADELALEFDHWYRVACGLDKLTPEHRRMLDDIDNRLDSIGGQKNADRWTDEALSNDPFWAEIRVLSKSALQALGEEAGPPGPPPGTYVAGG